jgi:hypothetical protein
MKLRALGWLAGAIALWTPLGAQLPVSAGASMSFA